MRKLIVSEFISLDGVIQAPGGAEEDTEGGATPYPSGVVGLHYVPSSNV